MPGPCLRDIVDGFESSVPFVLIVHGSRVFRVPLFFVGSNRARCPLDEHGATSPGTFRDCNTISRPVHRSRVSFATRSRFDDRGVRNAYANIVSRYLPNEAGDARKTTTSEIPGNETLLTSNVLLRNPTQSSPRSSSSSRWNSLEVSRVNESFRYRTLDFHRTRYLCV